MTAHKQPQAQHGTNADRADLEEIVQNNLASASLAAGLLAHGGRSGAQAAPDAEVQAAQDAVRQAGILDNPNVSKFLAFLKMLLELWGKTKGGAPA